MSTYTGKRESMNRVAKTNEKGEASKIRKIGAMILLGAQLVTFAGAKVAEARIDETWWKNYTKEQERRRIDEKYRRIEIMRQEIARIEYENKQIMEESMHTTDPEKIRELQIRQERLRYELENITQEIKRLRRSYNVTITSKDKLAVVPDEKNNFREELAFNIEGDAFSKVKLASKQPKELDKAIEDGENELA